MTYLEKFKNSKNYGIYQAQKMLDYYEKEGIKYFNQACNKHIDLLEYPECYMSENMKHEKEKALKNIEYLKNIVNGIYVNPVYTAYFNNLKNNEYPEWRNK